MRKLLANQLTQQHYGSKVTFGIPAKRGQSVHMLTLGHAHVEGEWVIIRAKGAHPFDAYRVRADSVVEVRA